MTTARQLKRGFSLIELMIAIALGLVITTVVLQIFLSSKQAYRLTEAHAGIQDNSRFAFQVLSEDIRQAGYAGCKNPDQLNIQVIASGAIPTFTDDTILTGHDFQSSNNWSPALSGTVSTHAVAGDVITLLRVNNCGATLQGNLTSSNANIQVNYPNVCNIDQNDIVMVSDCQDAHIFAVTNNPSTNSGKQTLAYGINNSPKVNNNIANHLCTSYGSNPKGACQNGADKLYGYDAEIYLFTAKTYYIGKSNNDFVLYSYDPLSNYSEPLAEGIEDMQIQYGIDDDDDDNVDRYENAKTVDTNKIWSKVISIKISLLAQSLDDNLTVDGQTYIYDGVNYTRTDGKLRRVYTSAITIRNRVQ